MVTVSRIESRPLACDPLGYSRALTAVGGRGGRPLVICQTTGPILNPKTAFGSTRRELSEYIDYERSAKRGAKFLLK